MRYNTQGATDADRHRDRTLRRRRLSARPSTAHPRGNRLLPCRLRGRLWPHETRRHAQAINQPGKTLLAVPLGRRAGAPPSHPRLRPIPDRAETSWCSTPPCSPDEGTVNSETFVPWHQDATLLRPGPARARHRLGRADRLHAGERLRADSSRTRTPAASARTSDQPDPEGYMLSAAARRWPARSTKAAPCPWCWPPARCRSTTRWPSTAPG